MNFEYNNKKYEVVIEKKNNKNTYIRVKEDLKIYVSTSYLTPKIMIKSLIENNRDSIIKMIQKREKDNILKIILSNISFSPQSKIILKTFHYNYLYIFL